MAEYIEREAAVTALTLHDCDSAGAKVAILDVPAADVAPVAHGRWFFKSPNGFACSRCGEWGLMIDNRGISRSKFCPNCGAKMDLENT